jgi:hypothetical protein
MSRRAGGILVLLLTPPAAVSAGGPGRQRAEPADEFQALVKEAQKAYQDYFRAVEQASGADLEKLRAAKGPQFGPRFLALAEKNPKTATALDALVWVVNDDFASWDRSDPVLTKAMELLLRDHLQSERLAYVSDRLSPRQAQQEVEDFLIITLLEKSPHKGVQAEACLCLAIRPLHRAKLAEIYRNDATASKRLTTNYGKEVTERLRMLDVDRQRAESAKYFDRFADQFSGVLPAPRLARLCLRFVTFTDEVTEAALQGLRERDVRPEVRGPATYALARLLRGRADALPAADARAVKLRRESEDLLEQAVARFADLKLEVYGTVGKRARKELFTLRHLTPGKAAPEIEGLDQDGHRFKLSDYRGKVVLLDFWSQH